MPETNPVTLIVAELLALLNASDFHPFEIVLADGSKLSVQTRDHLTITRLLRRVVMEHDDGTITFVNPLHITRLEIAA